MGGISLGIAPFAEHGNELLDIEWVALRNPADSCAHILGQLMLGGQLCDQLVGLGCRERLEPDLAASPGRTLVEQLGARKAQQEELVRRGSTRRDAR